MSHGYPLARSGADALDSGEPLARTRYDAERLAGEVPVEALETDWLSLEGDEAGAVLAKADAGRSAGFVQLYENADGSPVLAVTYWKLAPASAPATSPPPSPDPTPEPAEHTDDLYFRRGRTKKRKRKVLKDPNQMDLFGEPTAAEDNGPG